MSDTTEEIEFENRRKEIEAFKNDLKSLMEKYKFTIHGSNNYNSRDEYCGSDYYFQIDGETWYGETVDDILTDIVGEHH